jgi:hypothetical protein
MTPTSGDESEMAQTEPEPFGSNFDELNGGPDVAKLLAAASGPPRPDELDGEAAARAMFSSVHPGGGRDPASRSRKRRTLALSGRTKVLAAVATGALLLTGGTAAANGRLPDPVQRAVHGALAKAGISVPDAHESPAVDNDKTGSGGTEGGSPGTATTPPHPSGTGPVTGQTVCTVMSAGQCNPSPGNSGNAGKPVDPGNSGNAGKPVDPGNSGNAGKPVDPGNSGNAGKPVDPGNPANKGHSGKTTTIP